jgi:hypothetical protein
METTTNTLTAMVISMETIINMATQTEFQMEMEIYTLPMLVTTTVQATLMGTVTE